MTDARIAFVTAGSAAEAETIAGALVAEGLAACVNILPEVSSIYQWKGKTEKDTEAKMVIKTTAGCIEALISRVVELHSYEVCEVTVVPIVAGSEPYLNWIDANTRD
jgi:periplasmic divalent cation tolerance protein